MSKTKEMIDEDYERAFDIERMYIMEQESEMEAEFKAEINRIPAKINLTLHNDNDRKILHSDQARIFA